MDSRRRSAAMYVDTALESNHLELDLAGLTLNPLITSSPRRFVEA
jgi:hypothetical protein